MTSRTGSARRIWGILKKVRWVENWTPNEKGWLTLARWGLGLVSHKIGWGCRWKSQNWKNVYLSPYVEEPLNSKVIESFGLELRSRYVFFEFRDSYVLSLRTFDVRFTHSHIIAMVQRSMWVMHIRYKSSSSSSYCAADPLSPLLPIVHHPR